MLATFQCHIDIMCCSYKYQFATNYRSVTCQTDCMNSRQLEFESIELANTQSLEYLQVGEYTPHARQDHINVNI